MRKRKDGPDKMTPGDTSAQAHGADPVSPSYGGKESASLEHAIRPHKSGDTEQAEAAYTRLLQKEPTNPHIPHFLGILHMIWGHMDEAIPHLERAITLNPDFAEAHGNLGNPRGRCRPI